ncbi:MAG: heavy metal translocating P-type ATPase [Phycisphaerales bacterium]|nr:heavy metal translocating P-type ATPase [Phycisphaerales bacterium]
MPEALPASTLDAMRGADTKSNEAVLCDHCSLPVPKGLVNPSEEHQFCCGGCESVYKVLHGAGLDGYYGIRDAVSKEKQPAASSHQSYEELDDPAFQQACVTNLPGGQCETELLLEGMHCAACVWLIERLPRVCPGVVESRANIRTRSAVVRYAPDQVPLSRVAQALDKLGYAAHPARGAGAREARRREDRRFLIRVAVAGAIAGNVMLLAVALYTEALSDIEPFWRNTLRYYSMGLGLLSLLWPGRVFFTGAIAALRTRTAHLDIPVALALAVGGIWGSYNALSGHGEIYFDSLSVLVFLLLVGRWVQHRQQRGAADQVELMLTLTPTSAERLLEDGTTKRVPIEAIEVGHLVRVEAGGSIPVDGHIENGTTQVDNALLTGESRPIARGEGDEVIAGATNIGSPIVVRVSAVGDSTRAAKLMALVASATADKAPIVQFADRVAAKFVVVVIVLAIINFTLWSLRADLRTGIEFATALLIVTCPCALGLSTPMAMSIALGRAAKQGILIKSAAAIEAMSNPRSTNGVMILDKTGTLTQGQTRVVEVACDVQLLQCAAAIESHSNHPLARAIVKAVGDASISPASNITQTPGGGIVGEVDDRRVMVGSPAFIAQHQPISPETQQSIDTMLSSGLTPVVIADDSGTMGVVGIGDPLREDTIDAINALKARGWQLHLCSGDHPEIAMQIAQQVGIDHAMGGASPERKAELVRTLREQGHRRIVMVGDGINDAAAMALSDVGIAVHGGAEAALQAADVYLTSPGVMPIETLCDLGRHTMKTIRIGLGVSLTYNTVAATLAVAGLISALIAAVIMPLSSLSVVALATRPWKHRGVR